MRDRLIQLIALVVLAAGVVGAFLLTPTINRQRVDRQLTYDIEVGDNANPMYTLIAATGSFRGIMINILWQRAEKLKQEGKFFESNSIAEMITTLQPRFPDAWDNQAWNMSYNISVKCKTAEERWDWVQKGMALLRDRGIPNNPNAVKLYRSMSWILGHKMAGQTDDMHWYYKSRWIETWHVLLGEPPEGWVVKPEFAGETLTGREEFDPQKHTWLATERMRSIANKADRYFRRPARPADDYKAGNYFEALSQEQREAFYERYPAYRSIVAELEQLRGPNGEELGLGLNVKTLKAFGKLMLYNDAGYWLGNPAVLSKDTVGLDGIAVKQWIDTKLQADIALLIWPTTPQEFEFTRAQAQARNPKAQVIDLVPLLDLLRAQALIADYHMDPAYMLNCMERFGPIEWRHPSGHAVYWASLGVLRADQWTKNRERIDFINTNRDVIHGLQELTYSGKIYYRPECPGLGEYGESRIQYTNDTRMIPAYLKLYDETKARIEAGDFGDHNTKTYDTGHENFLQSAVVFYYFEGREDKAWECYRLAKKFYSTSERSVVAPDGHYQFNNIEDFVRVRLGDDLGPQTEGMILGWIRRGWQQGIASRDPNVLQRHLAIAQKSYDKYKAERQTSVKNDADVQGRQDIAPFSDMVLMVYLEYMNTPGYTLVQKAALWQLAVRLLPSVDPSRPLQFEAYLLMQAPLIQQAQNEGWAGNLQSIFPEPRGYAAWAARLQQQQDNRPAVIRPDAPGP